MLFQRITKGHACPVCKSSGVYRVKRAGVPVKVVCKLLNLRPHWCPDCDTFFLGPRHSKDVRITESFRSNGPRHGGNPTTGQQPASLR
jgi:hypothetical protein